MNITLLHGNDNLNDESTFTPPGKEFFEKKKEAPSLLMPLLTIGAAVLTYTFLT